MTEAGPDDDVTRRHVVVRGRVQGVFFRDTCRREARERGVSGWVRNTPDGAVEAVFEGDPTDVETMVAWCRVGPDLSRVDAVEVREVSLEGEREFRIV